MTDYIMTINDAGQLSGPIEDLSILQNILRPACKSVDYPLGKAVSETMSFVQKGSKGQHGLLVNMPGNHRIAFVRTIPPNTTLEIVAKTMFKDHSQERLAS